MSIYSYLDYKRFLAFQIRLNSSQRGYQTKLAEAAGCQRAYISQVMTGTVHLTFDHAAGLCEFWKFQPDETDFFFELLQLARASTPTLRRHVLTKIELIKARQSELSTKFQSTKNLSEADQSLYYSSWLYAAVHVMTSIPTLKKPREISERLNLPVSEINKVIEDLIKMQILEKSAHGYSPSERNLFLPRQSHMTYMLHSNWRLQALIDLQKGKADSIHYSTLHAISTKDLDRLRDFIVFFLKESKAMIKGSSEEEMICLNLDFFRI